MVAGAKHEIRYPRRGLNPVQAYVLVGLEVTSFRLNQALQNTRNPIPFALTPTPYYYLLKNPQKMKNNIPHTSLIRKNISIF